MGHLAVLSDRLSRLRWQGLQAQVTGFKKVADNQTDTRNGKMIMVNMKFIDKMRWKNPKRSHGHNCDL